MGSIASFGLTLLERFSQQQQTAEPSDATAAFGGLFWFVIALDVICTIVALYYLWRIWFGTPRPEVR
jgi:hypothetical protein